MTSDPTTKAAEIRAGLVAELRLAERIFKEDAEDWAAYSTGCVFERAAALIEQQAAELADLTSRLQEKHREVADLQQGPLFKLKEGLLARATTAESERDELLREKERLAKERDEARAYLKAFCRACVDSEFDRNPVGVHEANPSLGWVFSLDDMDVCPQQHITGGQVRRAMEIVGFDKLKIEPATRTISDELSENRAAARTAEATTPSQSERIAVLEAALRDEREACAQSISSFIQAPGNFGKSEDYLQGFAAGANYTADRNAVAIRARSALAPIGEE